MRDVSMRMKEEEEEKENVYYVHIHIERKSEKKRKRRKNNREKKVMFNIMPSLCSKVTSRRYYHLLVCICYTFRMMAC